MNDSSGDAIWFMGDLSDPWVVSIAGALAPCADIVQVHCPGDLPESPFLSDQPPRMTVVHRHRFTAVDAQRLKEYRGAHSAGDSHAIVLCISPYVRYEELERWSSLADLVISEATAADILPGHVNRLVKGRAERSDRAQAAGFRIEVAGSNHDLCLALVEACTTSGYRAAKVPDLEIAGAPGAKTARSRAPEPTLTVWDVPVLEPDWSQRLERRARATGPVIALLGFADRESVTLAKTSGAVACLELPFNVDDLIDVIDRAAPALSLERGPAPARVEQPHRLPPPPRGRKQRQEHPAAAVPWSDRDGKPRLGG